MKKLLSILLALAMMLSTTPLLAYAVDEEPAGEAPAAELTEEDTEDPLDEQDPLDDEEDENEGDSLDDEEDLTDPDDPDDPVDPAEDDGIDEFDENGTIVAYYDESDPEEDSHFKNGILSTSFKTDGQSVYYIGTEVWDSYGDEDLPSETLVKNGDVTKVTTQEDSWGYVWNPAELGQEGDVINVSLEKLVGPSRKGFYVIVVRKYDGYKRVSDFPASLTMKLDEVNADADPTDFGEEPDAYYKADYSIDDDSIAELKTLYTPTSTKLEVTAKKVGTAVITASLPDGRTFKCNLTVTPALEFEKNTIHIKESFRNELHGTTGEVTWSSSNSAIATVTADGTVTGVKKGTATITANDGSGEYKCVVTVKNPTMTKTAITPIVGQKYKLDVQGGSGKIKWVSSNKKIATVSSTGNVTAKSVGTCTITATRNGFKTTCKVTVVKKMTISKTAVSLTLGADGFDETATLKITGGVGDITWTSADESIAKVSAKGLVTPIGEGKTTVTAKRDGRTLKCTVYVEDYDNVVYSPASKWGSIDIPKSDEDGWFVKIRPQKTGYIKVKVNDGDTFIQLLNSNYDEVSEEEYCLDGDFVYYGVKYGKYYYLYFNDISDYDDEDEDWDDEDWDDDYDDYDDYDDDDEYVDDEDDDWYDYDEPYASAPAAPAISAERGVASPKAPAAPVASNDKNPTPTPAAPAEYGDEDDLDDEDDIDDEEDDYDCNISITSTKVINKCGYTKKGAKTLKKKTLTKGVIFAGDKRAHWYKFKLSKPAKIHIYFSSLVTEDASITIYQGSKVAKGGGPHWHDYEDYDTYYTTKKFPAGTYYVRIKPGTSCANTGWYKIKWY